jgi:predicted XRE-type DNA-binding protein
VIQDQALLSCEPVEDRELTVEYVEELAPKKLNDRHMYIAMLLAQGLTQKQVHDLTGITQGRLSIITRCEIMRREVLKLRGQLFERMSTDQTLERIGNKALRNLEVILDGDDVKSGTMIRAIEAGLDRRHGKPRQEVVHQGSLLREILEELRGTREKADGVKEIIQLPPEAFTEESAGPRLASKEGERTEEGENRVATADVGSSTLSSSVEQDQGERVKSPAGTPTHSRNASPADPDSCPRVAPKSDKLEEILKKL